MLGKRGGGGAGGAPLMWSAVENHFSGLTLASAIILTVASFHPFASVASADVMLASKL